MPKDIFDRLKEDHEEMRRYLDELVAEFDGSLFTKLARELESHQSAEEHVLYAAIVSDEKTHGLALEGKEEHHVADLLLRELKANDKGTDVWMAKLSVLKENVEHHLGEEEAELFPAARSVLSEGRALAMTGEFNAKTRAF